MRELELIREEVKRAKEAVAYERAVIIEPSYEVVEEKVILGFARKESEG